jgi:outer membrane lipoprotein SlyB
MIVGMVLLITLVGCANKHQVVIDPEGVDMARFDKDLAACRQISEQVDQKAGEGAVGGAVVSGLMGAIVGDSRTAKRWASVGAVGGAASGAAKTAEEKDRVVKNCMRKRGYQVLN